MKQFSNWEAREERKFHADLLQEQRGVLFVGDTYEPPPPDGTTGVLHISPELMQGGSKSPRPKRASAFASARRQDKKSITLPLPSSVQKAAPEQLHRCGRCTQWQDSKSIFIGAAGVCKPPSVVICI